MRNHPFAALLAVLLPLAVLVVGAAGCAAFKVPEEPATPTPADPVWNEAELREHLRFLNASETAGRATGTQAFAQAAAYVAARLDEFRLQPVLEDEFRVVYGTPLNAVRAAGVTAVGADTVLFLPGLDVLPDGRSDSGRVAVDTAVLLPALAADAPAAAGAVVLLAPEAVQEGRLARLAAAGVRAVLVVGPLDPVLAQAPVRGLLVLQVTRSAAARLLGVAPDAVGPLLAQGATRQLPRRLHLQVAATYEPFAGAINVVGYVVGKHPVLVEDAILVCADLDVLGTFSGVATLDFEHFGVGTAALLELARNFGHIARHWSMPDRTIVFAVFSGARTGHAGLRAYLRQPAWALDRTRAVVYLGLQPDEAPAVRTLLADHGLPLHAMPAPGPPLASVPRVVLPDPTLLRAARRAGRTLPSEPQPDVAAILTLAVEQARRLAETAYPLVLRESLGSDEGPLPNVE